MQAQPQFILLTLTSYYTMRREKTQPILAKKKKTLDNKKKCILRILTTLDLKNLRVCKTIQEV